MPDPPFPPKPRRPQAQASPPLAPSPFQYAELRCRTNFSFLEGASHPDELVNRAVELGYSALAVTDRNSLAGIVRAYAAAKETNLKLLVGAEVTPTDAAPAVLLATDRSSYGRLCKLLTTGRRRAGKGDCRFTFDDIASHSDGLLALVPLASLSESDSLERYRELFADRCYGLAELHLGPHDAYLLEQMIELSQRTGVPLAAANDVHYHISKRRFLQDALTAIRHRCTVAELGSLRFCNGERYLKSPEQMAALFASAPDAVQRTIEIADRCQFNLSELKYEYPEEFCPPGQTPIKYLKDLTMKGAVGRYPGGLPEKVRRSIDHELKLIEELHYEPYFLTVWDLVRYARRREILCQGRGSAANSAVCYCLGVTSVDPNQSDLLFERFLSKERDEAPDIDIDFEHERREEVIQYIYDKYGRERAGMAATVITYRPRSAVRDIGKALGLSLDRINTLAKTIDRGYRNDRLPECLREAGLSPKSRVGRQLMILTDEILGFPRHLSQHVGGMVMTQGLLCEMVPIENAAMVDRTVIQWDKDDLETLGILKVDCLCLGMLSAIRKSFQYIEEHYGKAFSLATIPQEDKDVYDMISRAETIGVFQIESRAQMSMLPRLRPQTFYDLVIEVAIVRPGPIQGDMVHPYLRRRNNEEAVEYPDERIKEVLNRTLGVPIFQEQAMKLAMVAAGFTPGEADQLRRAMAAWKRKGGLEPFRDKLMKGMLKNGYSEEFGERLFNQIRGFGDYGFPESHAASFALLAYASSWLKYHYPEVFTAGLINSQPMGFYAPGQLIRDARNNGIEVRPVDVNHSFWDCTLEESSRTSQEKAFRDDAYALRLGFRMISGLPRQAVERIVTVRRQTSGKQRAFATFVDFVNQTQLDHSVLGRLAKSDAFGSLDLSRRDAVWESLIRQDPLIAQNKKGASQKTSRKYVQLSLFDAFARNSQVQAEKAIPLPAMQPLEEVATDYQTTGLSLRQHPMFFLRDKLNHRRVATAGQLLEIEHGQRVAVCGLVLMRQRPSTAKGVTFVTLEDETGIVNLIVRIEVWERYYVAARQATIMLAHGQLQKHGEVIHVLVNRLQNVSDWLKQLNPKARNFR